MAGDAGAVSTIRHDAQGCMKLHTSLLGACLQAALLVHLCSYCVSVCLLLRVWATLSPAHHAHEENSIICH